MTNRTIAVAFTVGAAVGAVGERCFFRLQDKRKLQIEYAEKNLDEKMQQRVNQIFKYGAPKAGPDYSYFSNMVLNYSQKHKIPNWVAEHLTKDHITGDAVRKHCRFKRDLDIPEMFSSENTDYLGSGWSRGHMAAAGNNKYDQKAMEESFLLCNVLPQNLENNGGFWNRMEIFTRNLTNVYENVYVISGPVMMPIKEDSGKKYITYNLIGKQKVTVPTHLFKIVIAEDDKKLPNPAMAAFIVPNRPIEREKKLTDFQVPIEAIEERKGLTLLPKLNRETASDLCEETGCNLMPLNEFELYMICRKMQSANTLNRLDTVWAELKKKKLKPDEYTKQVYRTRKEEIEKIQVFQIKPGQE